MFRSCGCLTGMVLGFLLAIVVAFFVACAMLDKKPSEMRDMGIAYWENLKNEGQQAVKKAATELPKLPQTPQVVPGSQK